MTSEGERWDLAVIGGGILGLAAARELLLRGPGRRVVVVEKEPEVGVHQTGHSSGVIHSGIYYAPGSLKARLCVAGAAEMYDYCAANGIAHERCGKVIVASDDSQLPRLQALFERGVANGVEGLEVIGPERLREIEPNCVGVRAIWSPATGIADYRAVARSYARDIEAAGGEIRTGRTVLGIDARADGVTLTTSGGEVRAERVLACAGLHSDRVARLSGGAAEPAIIPFRGDYWVLRPERRSLVANLIYPVPDPAFPFLGIHFTRRVTDGAIWLGPNAVLAFAREGYGRLTTRPRDLLAALGHRGFRRLARRHWRAGAAEMWGDISKRAFLRSCQAFIPELTMSDLQPGPSGVRAQALGPEGVLLDDFVFEESGNRVIHVRNAPSPGATSSLAIARMIADRVDAGSDRPVRR